jgi:cytochrome P450
VTESQSVESSQATGDTALMGGRVPGGCPVRHLDFTSWRPMGAYWDLAKQLRTDSPYFVNTYGDGSTGYWVFTNYDAVRDIYKNPQIFSSESITPWEPNPIYRFIPTQIDPPNHIKYRRVLNKWFSPAQMDANGPMIRDICQRLVADTVPLGRCDFVNEWALRYPTQGFLGVIGAPLEDADSFLQWVADFFAGFGGDPEGLERMVSATNGIKQYWADFAEERRGESEPREGDLCSYLMHVQLDDGRSLTDEEVNDMLFVLTLAGLDTTRAELGYMFHRLATHPEDRKRLIAEPEIIPYAVEETLRLYTIIFGDGRKVAADVEFHGIELKKGDMVYGLVSAANRDPSAYERAEEYVVDRKKNNHFGFASGPHRCLGMHLARREMTIGVEEWLRAIPDFELESDQELLERGGASMMALNHLWLRWEVPA